MLWQRLLSRQATHVVTLNPEMIVRGQRDAAAAQVLHDADVYIADGVGLVWAAGVLRRPGIERFPGIDLAGELLTRLAHTGGSVYLLGARPGIAQQAGQRLVQQLPGLRLAGTHHGYFSAAEEAAVVSNIAAAQPDMLLVGMGSPRQEEFIRDYRSQLSVPLMVGVGGALEVFAGVKRRAPRWVQRAGIEWAYRSMADISRYKRLGVLPRFVGLVVREALGGAR